MSNFVPDSLKAAAAIYEERNKLYGDNYKKFGLAFWPILRVVNLEGPDDLNRFAVLIQILSKITRYCENFNAGGHADSLDDMAVYAMMLKELDSLLLEPPIALKCEGEL
jgi:hypothetical protein